MKILKYCLVLATLVIYWVTVVAISGHGFNWPAVYINDLLSTNWRSQFNTDFLIHLFLLATWVVWREGATKRGYLFGFLSIFMGGMFGFPYILYASIKARLDVKTMLLGVHAEKPIGQ